MQWRITNRNAQDNYVDAVSTDPIGYEYHGFMIDFQPNGNGALYYDGTLIKCGYWENGELPDKNRLTYEEYDKIMNEYFNK